MTSLDPLAPLAVTEHGVPVGAGVRGLDGEHYQGVADKGGGRVHQKEDKYPFLPSRTVLPFVLLKGFILLTISRYNIIVYFLITFVQRSTS
jgi:hypothetical protein